MKTVIDALRISCEKKNIYPKTGVEVFRFWIVILAFVGIQLAWNLRPFMGDEGKPFKLFREYEGNFYTAIIYSVRQLADSPNQNKAEKIKKQGYNDNQEYDDSLFLYELEQADEGNIFDD